MFLGSAGAGVGDPFPPRILNMTVPQVGHLPLIARRPFFMVSSTASAISFFDLHLTQYPSGIKTCSADPVGCQLQQSYSVGVPLAEFNW